MQCVFAWSLTLLAWPAAVQANYRKFGFLNHDLCTRVRSKSNNIAQKLVDKKPEFDDDLQLL